ncbi:MAG: DNA mismatch repair protein MutS [Deltaproteobacteria bacterium]|nr:DNA mismatch repair protein MutS [Deltaproteobacteria bacterium]MCB9489433.1 DNA mismatch repair protein MutS [Deltaproteobacteria bacterium]
MAQAQKKTSASKGPTPAMRQWFEVKDRYPDHVVLFRMGDFYEMFYEDAKRASELLDLTLTSRGKDSGNPIPLAGIPFHALTGYLPKLVSAGVKVAICEQTEDPKQAKGVVKREVTRVVTAGVSIEPETLDERNPNYLMGVVREGKRWGFTIAELTTGEFLCGGYVDDEKMVAEIVRREPAEIVVPQGLADDERFTALVKQAGGRMVNQLPDESFDLDDAVASLSVQFPEDAVDQMDRKKLGATLRSAGGVLRYLLDTQLRELGHINRLRVFKGDEFMVVDETAKRNLELVASMREGGRRGSLLGLLDETVTAMGARLLKQWVLYPLLSVDDIDRRLDAVDNLKKRAVMRIDLRDRLQRVHDLERLCSRISLAVCNARDLVSLSTSLEMLPSLKALLAEFTAPMIADLVAGFDDLGDVRAFIHAAVDEEPPLTVREGNMIRDGYNAELDDLRAISRKGKGYLSDLEARERERTGIGSLKVRYNKVFGYYLEISNTHKDKVPDDYIRKQTLVNAERYITPELKEYEDKVLTAQDRITALEYDLFVEVRERVAAEVTRIQAAAQMIATLDVLSTFAHLAETHDYVRPEMDESDCLEIRDGRHPVVERTNPGERFIPNDCVLDTKSAQIAIITGPNMAGKSTYIRQIAVIALMAQVGSFVPAKKARIGVIDRVFTRVGASDNLARGQSTFMVEMSETAEILRHATKRSLIILDEIGRGTSTFDGLSIAWAVTEYLHDTPGVQAKTLFATHYHELVDLARTKARVKNFNVKIIERNDDLVFLHRIVEGSTNRSYGIQVARLAGLPQDVIERAKEILHNLESGELDELDRPRLAVDPAEPRGAAKGQLGLFAAGSGKAGKLADEVRALDPISLTPIEALNALAKLKAMLDE